MIFIRQWQLVPFGRSSSDSSLATGHRDRIYASRSNRSIASPGRGVYYGAARTEAGAMQGRDIFLIGAGNSAGQAAVFFANHARSVTPVVRGEALGKSMSHYLIQQLQAKPNVSVALRSEIVAVHGDEQLESVDSVDHVTGTTARRAAGGLFVFIGADASTEWLPPEIARDELGYVQTGLEAVRSGRWTAAREPFLLETTVPGVFAVGDVRAGSVKRVASAVGDGSLAITFARQHLEELARGDAARHARDGQEERRARGA